MGIHKDFDAALAETLREKPTFTLAGQRFTCKARLSWKSLISLYDSDDEGLGTSVAQFFAIVLVKADRERFFSLIDDEDPDDDDYAVSVDQIRDVMGWLTEHYTGKAEGQPADSSDGPPTTGQQSRPRVVNLSQVG